MEYGPIREMKGDTILSPSMPRLGIQISPDFIYLGDLQYIARGTHHAEAFIFISPNGVGHVTRILLVHFEGFLENQQGEYRLAPQDTLQMDHSTYAVETSVIDLQEYIAQQPRSDLAHAADYIRQRGYTLTGDMRYLRFSRLVSDDQRNLFVIACLDHCTEDESSCADPVNGQAVALSGFQLVH